MQSAGTGKSETGTSSLPGREGQATRPYAAYVKRFVFFYLMGFILALEAAGLVEGTVEIPLWWRLKVLFIGLAAPSLLAWFGVLRFPPRAAGLPTKVWAANVLILFVFWAGGYMLIGELASHGPFDSLQTRVDNRFPLIPQWVFVYLSVYFLFLLPFFHINNPRRLVTMDLAQLVTLTVCYVMFVVYPVAAPRPEVTPRDFSTIILSILQGADPSWNCFPSTHCSTCTIAALALVREHRLLGAWALVSTAAICLSTLFTVQHYVLDVIAGVLLGGAVYLLVYWVCERTAVARKLEPLLAFMRGPESQR